MPKMIVRVFCVSLALNLFGTLPCFANGAPAAGVDIGTIEPIDKADRILVLAPHPDDEAIGCGGVIQAAVAAGSDIHIAYLTNGDHNEPAFIVYEKRLTLRTGEFVHMGEVRRLEAIAAMKLLGVNERNLIFLGYPDFGTLKIFTEYWQTDKPYKSILTRISGVPYKANLSYGAPYIAENILADLKKVIAACKPNKIFVSHPADSNGDHKALYLFLQIALHDLAGELPSYKVYPYLVHCPGWPLPRRYHPGLSLTPPAQFIGSQMQWARYALRRKQLNKKYQAILAYKSQTSSSAFYLLAFARTNELFGDYPDVALVPSHSRIDASAPFLGFSNIVSYLPLGLPEKDLDRYVLVQGQVSYHIDDAYLSIKVEKQRGLGRSLKFMFYLFGYRDNVAFARMPKIRILTNRNKCIVFDGRKKVSSEGVTAEFKPGKLLLRVPLALIGAPEFVLSAVKVYSGIFPLEISGFRKVDLK